MTRKEFEEWKAKTIKITEIKKGGRFSCISGRVWIMERKERNLSFVMNANNGEAGLFANCARVIPG